MSIDRIKIQLADEQLEEFRAFFMKEFNPVVGLLIKTGASREDAEDAAQEAMQSVLRGWPGIEHPKAFVCKAAIRVRNRIWEKARADQQPPVLSEEVVAPFDAREDVDEVLKQLRSLPPMQRTVLALHVDGFEPAEIAEITGENADTVRSNLRHARRKLIRKLDPDSIPKEANHGS